MEIFLPWAIAGGSFLLALFAILRGNGSNHFAAQQAQARAYEAEYQRNQITELERVLSARIEQLRLENRQFFDNSSQKSQQDQSDMRLLLSEALRDMAERQQAQVATLQQSVNERLQGTVEKQMQNSFQRVVEQFATMQKALGEVRNVTAQISDLKRLFANVKTRGGWGETQCRAILDDILPEGSYDREFRLSPQTGEVVEFAVKMPSHGHQEQPRLAIDCKFPTEAYERLINAAEMGDAEGEKQARKALETVVKLEAKKISQKYIRPPVTVDFAVLYVPTDGLYAEIARSPGLIDEIGRLHRIIIMGPALLPALLRTVHLGYVTLALEERTEVIAGLLGETRQEMIKIDQVLEKLQRNAGTMGNTIEEARRRSRILGRRLNALEDMSQDMENEFLTP
ncbi:DNA recombination protein RmuC [Aristophania vespae]|uniref:DNA recombination protein RmuC homolog n=1 Tax=Aristophania vespae TaxID=2697033 RepID=A0A6P1NHA9_9PROT|nr:DNA recombination protein RmuC [Aristophania vespae]QHI95920.1 DNA recombination protein RmuC [Aristophania vespae]